MNSSPESSPIDHAESIVNALGDGAYVLDADRNRVFVNDRLREVTGFDQAVLHAKHPERLVEKGYWSAETGDRYRAAADRVLDGEADDERVQLTTTLADGREITTETRLTPIERDGSVVGAVGVIRDVTDRVQRERELKRLNERLERLAGFLSHDLRNPLSVARGYVDLARETGDTERLAAAEGAFGRIESMIDEALVMARDPDEVETADAAVDLAELAADCLESGDPGDQPADADLVVDDPGPVAGDPTLLRRAVGNLIGNAFEHGDDDVTVRVGIDDRGVYVADDGPGLPADERDRAALTDFGVSPGGGTGIGLAIVERVAAAHGWTLDVDESASGGFRATLVGAEPTK
ncbi:MULTISPECIES: sensor histidine kinase [Halorubrum]|uniref:histidine kinase n=1 Tax=Halorubrum sodomense TaxID=35743 RepID=A0A1I6FKF9_HALSD|nr:MULTISPECIES: PAS domain-containing sensor histidine kinase [Halorubrum]TKX54162.1 PAS domain-containing sensor histidine kinase [Halorubrum sp. SP3]SFR30433.1 PAS domain S-box-containing protein [Halorubrum sodomense]